VKTRRFTHRVTTLNPLRTNCGAMQRVNASHVMASSGQVTLVKAASSSPPVHREHRPAEVSSTAGTGAGGRAAWARVSGRGGRGGCEIQSGSGGGRGAARGTGWGGGARGRATVRSASRG